MTAVGRFEARLAGGVHLYDCSDALPRHATKRYRERDPEAVEHLFHHHSGALGAPGFRGAMGTAAYVVRHRGWPGAAYTYWLSYEPDRDSNGALVVYRLQPSNVRSYHTGGRANTLGEAVAWQGNLAARKPSDAQIEMAEALVPWWLAQRPHLDARRALSFHAEADQYGGHAKPSCPGPHVTQWVVKYRSLVIPADLVDTEPPPAVEA